MQRVVILQLLVLLTAAGCDYQEPVSLDFSLDRSLDAQIAVRDPLNGEPIRSYTLVSGSDAHRRLLSWLGSNQSNWFASDIDQPFVQVELTIGDLEVQLVTNRAVVKFQDAQYLKPVETKWLIEVLKNAET